MSSIDKFKNFVKNNPKLINHVRNGNMSWQKFYELYDLYGEDNNVWNEYITDNRTSNTEVKNNTNSGMFSSILEMAKNIDTNKLQDGISSIQKALGLFGDMLIKDKPEDTGYTPRPIYRRFDD